jgi:hypothetical protein
MEYSDDMALIILTEKTRNRLTKKDLFILQKGTQFIKERGFIKR